jgi:hypothetical protein
MERTAEQIVKFDSRLSIGRHLVTLTNGKVDRLALVEIGKRGAVYVLAKPDETDMYVAFHTMKGNKLEHCKRYPGVFVWGGREGGQDYTLIHEMFSGEPVATVRLSHTTNKG